MTDNGRRGQVGDIIAVAGGLMFTFLFLDILLLGWVVLDTPIVEIILNAI
jgi:hypothetical protein